MKSVTKNMRSIFLTMVFAIILVYLFSIVGFVFFQDDFLIEAVDLNRPVTAEMDYDNEDGSCSADQITCSSRSQLMTSDDEEPEGTKERSATPWSCASSRSSITDWETAEASVTFCDHLPTRSLFSSSESSTTCCSSSLSSSSFWTWSLVSSLIPLPISGPKSNRRKTSSRTHVSFVVRDF